MCARNVIQALAPLEFDARERFCSFTLSLSPTGKKNKKKKGKAIGWNGTHTYTQSTCVFCSALRRAYLLCDLNLFLTFYIRWTHRAHSTKREKTPVTHKVNTYMETEKKKKKILENLPSSKLHFITMWNNIKIMCVQGFFCVCMRT